MKTRAAAYVLAWLCGGAALAAPGAALLEGREPRAFGYQLGDVVARSVSVYAADGLVLDEKSVPRPGVRGKALELRSVARQSRRERGGVRHELRLEYQVMLSPPQVRTLELPGFSLRFDEAGSPRAQEVRVEAWPVTVSPLAPPDVSPRRGLGEMQPDTPPPLIDLTPAHRRLRGYAGVTTLLLAWLAHVYFGLPWWRRAHRPFTLAWRALRALAPDSPPSAWRAALQRVHEALNRTAGEVVFEHGVAAFVSAQPRFEPLRDDLAAFFDLSRREFFEGGESAAAERAWLVAFCRRCRDSERGA
jgi:mxaA protein